MRKIRDICEIRTSLSNICKLMNRKDTRKRDSGGDVQRHEQRNDVQFSKDGL